MPPWSAQSDHPAQGPMAQVPLTQKELVEQSLLTTHWPQKPQPPGLVLGTLGSLTGPASGDPLPPSGVAVLFAQMPSDG